MNFTLNIDPSDPDDIEQAAAVLAVLRRLGSPADPPTPSRGGGTASLEAVIEQIANPAKYGENRLGYLRRVAAAGAAGIAVSDLLEEHFGASYKGFGGTHSSIERSWRALGGSQWADQLIAETPDARQVMYAPAIPLVQRLLGEASTN